ncbi:hypothetical protein BC826DRAFT_558255 [Russula brevipes]|nr:hypothetical protein BC826DRAFT_558255 [Russula brevipes]
MSLCIREFHVSPLVSAVLCRRPQKTATPLRPCPFVFIARWHPHPVDVPSSAFIIPARVLDVSHKKARECIAWDAVAPVADRIRPGTAVLFSAFRRAGAAIWGGGPCRSSYHHHHVTPVTLRSRAASHHYFDHPWLAADVAERLLALGVARRRGRHDEPRLVPFACVCRRRRRRAWGGGENGAEGGRAPFLTLGVHLGAPGLIVENLGKTWTR